MMVHLILAAAFDALAVTKATVAPAIDGKLDDACWRDAKWESDFRRLAAYAKVEGAVPETKFAFAADEHNLYFAARCVEEDIEKVRAHKVVPVWFGNNVEIFLSPSGRTDDFYHFALSPNTDRVLASYYAESGGIQPDPYSPAWRHACVFADGAWTPLDAKVTHDGLRTELVFDGRRTANRFRLDFPADKKHPVDFELYEIEIPYAR